MKVVLTLFLLNFIRIKFRIRVKIITIKLEKITDSNTLRKSKSSDNFHRLSL